jgi:hypothetical protein
MKDERFYIETGGVEITIEDRLTGRVVCSFSCGSFDEKDTPLERLQYQRARLVTNVLNGETPFLGDTPAPAAHDLAPSLDGTDTQKLLTELADQIEAMRLKAHCDGEGY